jgi:alpha-L-arabinofuranosidase
VGDTSPIANIRGFRKDVIDALVAMKIPQLRWPGGCFADTYHWKDGIGPREKRPSIVNIHWGGVTEDNSFGTHEFLDFCELINAEPYIAINVGSGTVQEASEWVEYVTSSNKSPMTDLRKLNGREDPWNVKYWGIGNENWGCGGHMTPEYYTDLYKQFASYCGGAKYKVAGGPSSNDYNWTRVLMEKGMRHPHLLQGISLHHYSIAYNWDNKGDATGFAEIDWFSSLKSTYQMEELVTRHCAIMDQYDPQNKVGFIVDEWGNWFNVEKGTNPGFLFQQNTMRDAVGAAINLNIFNNYAHRVKMANIAQMVNVLQAVILTKNEQMVLTPTYYVFKMFSVHHDATLIPSNLKTETYEFKGEKIPAISSSASVKDGKVNITLTNNNPNKPVTIECNLTGKEVKSAKGQIINAKSKTDYNDFGKAETVTIADFKVENPKNGKLSVTLPAHSVVLITLQ